MTNKIIHSISITTTLYMREMRRVHFSKIFKKSVFSKMAIAIYNFTLLLAINSQPLKT